MPEVIVADGRPFNEILKESSEGADLVFLGMKEPEPGGDYVRYYEGLLARTEGLPTTAFVLAAEDLEFEEIMDT